MLLADLVDASARVAATRSRKAKVVVLAEALVRADEEEVGPAAAFLAGQLRQGRVGVGWGVLSAVEADPAPSPALTVTDVDRAVTELAGMAGPGSGTARSAALGDLFSRATAAEADFLRRLLLGELRQGALESLVTDALAVAVGVPAEVVRRAVMLDGDLSRVATVARVEGEDGLCAIGLQLFRPVLPMLAASAADVVEAIGACGLSSVEWKLDGARIQAHRDGEEVRLFTRNLNDVTARLPGVVELVRSLPARQLVLDGEVLGVGADDRPEQFQDIMSRFARHAGGSGRHDGGGGDLGVRFFDLLHLDGRDLLDEPLLERAALLEEAVGPWRIPSVVTDDPDVAADFAAGALHAGHEGVMVKGASSRYEAGRRGSAWRKVKPVQTLDLVVLGAEWGHGRRRGWLSNLHLGARGPDGGFLMVGKTFKGLTDELLAWQTEQLLAREVSREGIVVLVRPELVVEVALDGVLTSDRYPGGVSLRFARVRRYRPDKTPAEADDIETVRAVRPGSART
ncbi:MAG TPA: ATP-dependent DNA ligase [Acidimicrobiales bacterium]|nr:ATP-dependent DNA ligase [Acidimicrobiales bacterium]